MVTVTIACSEDKERIARWLTARFHDSGLEGALKARIKLEPYFYDDPAVIRAALGRDFGIVAPDSATSLDELEFEWLRRYPDSQSPIADRFSFAASPVVVFVRPEVAAEVSNRTQLFGWRTLFEMPASLPINIMHAHPHTPSGRSIAIALSLAAQGGESHLDTEDEYARRHIEALERRVREYGPDDAHVLERAFSENEWRTDLVIAEERAVLRALARHPEIKGTLVYPSEGTVWVEQSLAYMQYWDDKAAREVYGQIKALLTSQAAREVCFANALHPLGADLGTLSEVTALYAAQQTSISDRLQVLNSGAPPLRLPGRNVVRRITDAWANLERPADVCLVVDTSGSMGEHEKLDRAKAGIRRFLDFLRNPATRLGVIAFDSDARVVVPLQPAVVNRAVITAKIDTLRADGRTALLDALALALDQLSGPSVDRMLAIVALTDGHENQSRVSLSRVEVSLAVSGVTFYGIMYGEDADVSIMQRLASQTDGMAVSGSSTTIEDLYRRLATHV
jgi:Ca-activated chloride channel family protein